MSLSGIDAMAMTQNPATQNFTSTLSSIDVANIDFAGIGRTAC